MKKYLAAFVLLFLVYSASAQESQTYNRAIGIKFPAGFAITYKQFVTDRNNVEGEAMFWSNGFRAVGLYEFNFDIEGVDGLRWYVGPGAHIGFWNHNYQQRKDISSAGFGIDGVLGLDYKLADYPINVSVDWQPAVDLVGSSGFTPAYGGIGIRYTF
jgi:hypothetical protein